MLLTAAEFRDQRDALLQLLPLRLELPDFREQRPQTGGFLPRACQVGIELCGAL